MKVVSPDFGKQKSPEEQVVEMTLEHLPKLIQSGSFKQAVFIVADDENMNFLTNLPAPEMNLLIDVAKQYVLLGE